MLLNFKVFQLEEFDNHVHGILKDFINYCKQAMLTLKAREQRQIDYEDLTAYLKNHIEERDKIIRTGDPNAGSNPISHFIQKKLDDFKGVDQDRARQLKLNKLEAKITEVKGLNSFHEIIASKSS